MSVEEQGRRFLAEFTSANTVERAALRESGQKLAWRLRSAAIGLSSDKATEFSANIEQLILLAAKVAYLAYGPQAQELDTFESGVHYYRNFKPPSPIVEAYDAFKRSCGA